MLTDILTEDRWIKGFYRSASGERICLSEAVVYDYPDDIIYVVEAIKQLFPERYLETHFKREHILINFNDHPQTVFQDIIKVLRQADELKDLEDALNKVPVEV